MKTNDKISTRRQEIGLTKTELANSVGLSFNEYFDIELHADEIFSVTDLKYAKAICIILKLDFLNLFNMKCDFCNKLIGYDDIFLLPRNKLIEIKRVQLGLSTEEFGDRVGFSEIEIEKLEMNPEHLETWPIDFIKDLAKVIDVPLQILLNVKCKKCGK